MSCVGLVMIKSGYTLKYTLPNNETASASSILLILPGLDSALKFTFH